MPRVGPKSHPRVVSRHQFPLVPNGTVLEHIAFAVTLAEVAATNTAGMDPFASILDGPLGILGAMDQVLLQALLEDAPGVVTARRTVVHEEVS